MDGKSGFFYILLTAVLQLLPDPGYERYIRMFMGVILVFMLCSPVLSVLGKGEKLLNSFQDTWQGEMSSLEKAEQENLQEFFLAEGYSAEIRASILETLEEREIWPREVAVTVEGEQVTVVLYMEGKVDQEQEGRIADGMESCGLEEENYSIVDSDSGEPAVADPSPSGADSGRGGSSGPVGG
ncbi:MAG: stage III sporulation protein AF [Clostridiales bacterium]|nr:stage III sporulation protein AF [Clostridiales bacterium]